jgi:Bax protein
MLLERVDAVPTSIILAQGALESSWGSSRFTREGNSIFGMWTWKTPGIVPSRREEGKTHKVKAYENVLEAVRAYHLTLNRVESYEEFRQLRRNTDNPLILAEGLRFYSERGQDYVEDIKNVILSNDLQKYDNFSLTDLDLPEFSGSVSGAIDSVESGKASL